LRNALMDLQQLSAEHALVGKLEAELMQARVAARTAERKCGEYQVRLRVCMGGCGLADHARCSE
jgi:hypothetical protein